MTAALQALLLLLGTLRMIYKLYIAQMSEPAFVEFVRAAMIKGEKSLFGYSYFD